MYVQENLHYDAFEEDLAILNVYFSETTAVGNMTKFKDSHNV